MMCARVYEDLPSPWLGSRLIAFHSQNKTVAANVMAEMKRTRSTDEQILGILGEHGRHIRRRREVRLPVPQARHIGRHVLQLEAQARRHDGLGPSG